MAVPEQAPEVSVQDAASEQAPDVPLPDIDTNVPLPRWKLNIVTLGLCITLLLSTLETTIVSTALVAITDDLDGFAKRDWIVTSYLLTYTGFLTIFAKFADIFGRKVLLLFALAIFVLFSILCGAARSINTLIILRAFQGIGGSGIYSLVSVIALQITPRKELAQYGAALSVVFVLASVLGPVLGGIITTDATWPWVFYLNGPVGLLGALMLILFLPSTHSDKATLALWSQRALGVTLRRLDGVGALLLLSASVLLVFVLEEAGTRYAWSNGIIIAVLVISLSLWIAFPLWEFFVAESSRTAQESVFPIRLLNDRMVATMMLYGFFTGFSFMGVLINLPQRFQIVDGVTPFEAGIYLLPLLLSSPFSAAVCGFLTSKLKIAPLYLLVASAALQILGLALMTTLPSESPRIPKQVFGFQVILGLSFGLGLTTLLVMIPLVVGEAQKPVLVGAVTQIRVLGGTIGLAILAQLLTRNVAASLTESIGSAKVHLILESASSISQLTESEQNVVRVAFANGYTLIMKVLIAFSGLALITSACMWQRHPIKL